MHVALTAYTFYMVEGDFFPFAFDEYKSGHSYPSNSFSPASFAVDQQRGIVEGYILV